MKFYNKKNNYLELIEKVILLFIGIAGMIGAFFWDFNNIKVNIFVLTFSWSILVGSVYLIYSHLKN